MCAPTMRRVARWRQNCGLVSSRHWRIIRRNARAANEVSRHPAKSVQKQLDRLADDVARRTLARLAELELVPRPPDVKKLKGRSAWRIRVGDYRVIYEIHDRELVVVVVTVGHRREVYR